MKNESWRSLSLCTRNPYYIYIYINDLSKYISQGYTILYDDDTSVLIKSNIVKLQQKIHTRVSQLENWFQHKLNLTMKKLNTFISIISKNDHDTPT